jgi:hypothetical protein
MVVPEVTGLEDTKLKTPDPLKLTGSSLTLVDVLIYPGLAMPSPYG